jgi:hypothetical protein
VPRPPVGHPDLVLAKAVACGVVTAGEAELIGATRLEETTLVDWADRHQMSRKACYEWRARAEARLVAALRAGVLSDPTAETVAEATTTMTTEVATDPTGWSEPVH